MIFIGVLAIFQNLVKTRRLELGVGPDNGEQSVEKGKRAAVHALVVDHDAAAIRRYRLLEFIEQITPAHSRIPLLAGVKIDIYKKISQFPRYLRPAAVTAGYGCIAEFPQQLKGAETATVPRGGENRIKFCFH